MLYEVRFCKLEFFSYLRAIYCLFCQFYVRFSQRLLLVCFDLTVIAMHNGILNITVT